MLKNINKMDNNKKVLIGLSVLTLAGIGFYFWKKNKDKDSVLKNIQQKLNQDLSSMPKPDVSSPKVDVKKEETKSSFNNEVIAYKCSCTGKQIDVNAEAEVMNNFKNSCLKNGGVLIDIKSK